MQYVRRMLPSSGIRAIFDRASEIERCGNRVWHLEIGRPDWKLPPGAVCEAKEAIDKGFVHYITNRGLIELRHSVAQEVKRTTGRSYDPETEIIITTGASEAICMCALALLGVGDEVIVPEPTWPHYKAIVQMAGATPVLLPLSPDNGYLLDPEYVANIITPKTKMLVVNTPGNPTGTVQPEEYLQEISNLAQKHGFFILADEVYQDFVYEGQHVSMATLMQGSELLLLVNSFSKSYAMTGWRVGYVAASSDISDALNRIHQYLTVCGVPFAQKGAVAMLNHPKRQAYLKEMRIAFKERYLVWRDAFVNCSSVKLVPPGGAFYIFPRIEYKEMSGRQFCNYMIEEHHVAMVPGEIFGERYTQHVRISYGRDIETQQAAAAKILEVLHG